MIGPIVAKPATLLLAGHFGDEFAQRAREYAAHLARANDLVGLVLIDSGGVQVSCFDSTAPEQENSQIGDGQALAEVLSELNCDVRCWVIAAADAIPFIQNRADVVMLACCDQQGIIESYRALKAMDHHRPAKLSLALVKARDLASSQQMHARLASAAKQFLGCEVSLEGTVLPSNEIHEHAVIALTASPAVTSTVANFFQNQDPSARVETSPPFQIPPAPPEIKQPFAPAISPDIPQIFDLSTDTRAGVFSAVIQSRTGLLETPLHPPRDVEIKVAVDRDRRVVLIGFIEDLADIARAKQWATENAKLLSMALPQINLDVNRAPQVLLIADKVDSPGNLFSRDDVVVLCYRKVRWGDRVGVLIEGN